MTTQQPLYPIREVSRITGVNAITLRAWERRYGLIEPIRTDSGHRLYDQSHIDAITQAVELTKQGVPISQVKSLLAKPKLSVQPQPSAQAVEIDFVSNLTNASLSCDFAQLNQLLDRLFSDVVEQQAFSYLSEVNQAMMPENVSAQVVWRSCVLPRLMTRLRYLCQQSQIKPRKVCLVQSASAEANPVEVALVRLWLAGQGYLPFSLSDYLAPESINGPVLKQLGADLICLVANSAESVEAWKQWARTVPTIEVSLIALQVGNGAAATLPVNMQYQPFEQLFA